MSSPTRAIERLAVTIGQGRPLLALGAIAGALTIAGCDWVDQLCGPAPIAIEGENLCGEGLEVNHGPKITELEFAPIAPRVGEDVRFEAKAEDSDGDRLSFYWDFNQDCCGVRYGVFIGHPDPEGTVSRDAEEATYGRRGWYEGTLTVRDFPEIPASSDRLPLRVRVHSSAEFDDSVPPMARFTASPNARVGQQVTFNASASSDPDGDEIIRYRWDDDGDGGYDHEADIADPLRNGVVDPLATHTYTEPGPHRVTLEVTDEVGRTGTVTEAITVASATGSPPSAALEIIPNPALVDQNVSFEAYGSTDPEGNIARYEWDLDGNGTFERTTTEAFTSRSYPSQGEVPVTVRVIDVEGLSDAASETLSVIEEGLAKPGGSLHPRQASKTASRGTPLAFAAHLPTMEGTARVSGHLITSKGRRSSVQRTIRRFLNARWRSRLPVERDANTGEATVTGLALARAGKGRGQEVCLRLRLRLRPDELPTGSFRALGGTRSAARVRARSSFRFQIGPSGEALALGTVRAARGGERPLPRDCRRLR